MLVDIQDGHYQDKRGAVLSPNICEILTVLLLWDNITSWDNKTVEGDVSRLMLGIRRCVWHRCLRCLLDAMRMAALAWPSYLGWQPALVDDGGWTVAWSL